MSLLWTRPSAARCLLRHAAAMAAKRLRWWAASTVRPVASFGFEEGYLEGARVTWADDDRGREMRLGRHAIVNGDHPEAAEACHHRRLPKP